MNPYQILNLRIRKLRNQCVSLIVGKIMHVNSVNQNEHHRDRDSNAADQIIRRQLIAIVIL